MTKSFFYYDKGPRGVRKVNEKIVEDGRALIVTDGDKTGPVWHDIPYGSLHIDPETGKFYIKQNNKNYWQLVDFTRPCRNLWENEEEFPMEEITEEEGHRILEIYIDKVRQLEKITYGTYSYWAKFQDISSGIKQSRLKLIDLFEAVCTDVSFVFSRMVAYDMESAFDVLNSGINLFLEAIVGEDFAVNNMGLTTIYQDGEPVITIGSSSNLSGRAALFNAPLEEEMRSKISELEEKIKEILEATK